ncbi:hypothetical protein ABPG72_002028 [Tetrahymena utriculariae]
MQNIFETVDSIVVSKLSLDSVDYTTKPSGFSIETLKDDEFIAKVLYTPISDYSIHEIKGHFPTTKIPYTPGFEATGEIAAGKSEKVKSLIGKKVSFKVNIGAWQNYTIGSLRQAIVYEDGVDLKKASAACYVNPLTVAGMLELIKKNNPKAIINTGAGSSIGRMLYQGCKSLNVEVVNIVRNKQKAETLKKELGAEHVLSTEDVESFRTEFQNVAAKLQATVCFECVGGSITGVIFNALPPNSTLYVYGTLSGQDISGVNGVQVRWANKKIKGYLAYTWFEKLTEDERNRVHSFISQNLNTIFSANIQGEFPLSQTKEAIEHFSKDMSAGKVILIPQ